MLFIPTAFRFIVKKSIQIKHPFHHFPFLIGSFALLALLENGYIIFPFLLSWQCSEFSHGFIPIEIQRCLYDHEHTVTDDIYFHFQDAHGTDTFSYLFKAWFPIVSFTDISLSILDHLFKSMVWQYLYRTLVFFFLPYNLLS